MEQYELVARGYDTRTADHFGNPSLVEKLLNDQEGAREAVHFKDSVYFSLNYRSGGASHRSDGLLVERHKEGYKFVGRSGSIWVDKGTISWVPGEHNGEGNNIYSRGDELIRIEAEDKHPSRYSEIAEAEKEPLFWSVVHEELGINPDVVETPSKAVSRPYPGYKTTTSRGEVIMGSSVAGHYIVEVKDNERNTPSDLFHRVDGLSIERQDKHGSSIKAGVFGTDYHNRYTVNVGHEPDLVSLLGRVLRPN